MSNNFCGALSYGDALEAAEALAWAHPQQIDTEDLTAALINALRRIHQLERQVEDLTRAINL
jgi:hypothetical protein